MTPAADDHGNEGAARPAEHVVHELAGQIIRAWGSATEPGQHQKWINVLASRIGWVRTRQVLLDELGALARRAIVVDSGENLVTLGFAPTVDRLAIRNASPGMA